MGPKRKRVNRRVNREHKSLLLPSCCLFLPETWDLTARKSQREGPARLNPPGRMGRQEGTEGQGGKPPCRQGGRGQAILSQRMQLPYQTPWVCPFGDHWVTLQWPISESSNGVLREAIFEGLSRGRGGAQIKCALFRKTRPSISRNCCGNVGESMVVRTEAKGWKDVDGTERCWEEPRGC